MRGERLEEPVKSNQWRGGQYWQTCEKPRCYELENLGKVWMTFPRSDHKSRFWPGCNSHLWIWEESGDADDRPWSRWPQPRGFCGHQDDCLCHPPGETTPCVFISRCKTQSDLAGSLVVHHPRSPRVADNPKSPKDALRFHFGWSEVTFSTSRLKEELVAPGPGWVLLSEPSAWLSHVPAHYNFRDQLCSENSQCTWPVHVCRNWKEWRGLLMALFDLF